MFSLISALNSTHNWLVKILSLPWTLWHRDSTHNYLGSRWRDSYLFETLEQGTKGYITAQGRNVQCGDYLILPYGSGSAKYQVEEINYYSNPPDMWIALVRKV